MTYAIIGFGAVGQALAAAFARKGIDVAVAGRRPPEALAQQAAAIGPTVKPKTLEEALSADTILLAVPFWQHREVAKALASWAGKTIVDVTNAFGVPVEELDGLPSSAVDAAVSGVALAERLGVAPVKRGRLAEGGALVQARGHSWAALIFQDLIKVADR